MNKNKFIYIIISVLLIFPLNVFAVDLPQVYSKNILIYDLTDNKVLQARNTEDRVYIASLTKIVTTITAIENIDDLDREVTVTEEMLSGIPWDASKAGLVVGDVLSVRDVLYASILPSGADATQVLAYVSSGSISGFVEKMNDLAKKVGANNTHFVNTTGYDADGHYSTIEDILKIIKYSLNNPTFKTIFCTKNYVLKNGKEVSWTVGMYNKFMNLNIDRILGSKTGYTSRAGLCIAALYESHNHEMLMITLNANPYIVGNFYNLRDAVKLIEFTDNNYDNQVLVKKGDYLKSIEVELSKIDEYEIVADEDLRKFLPNDFDINKLEIEYNGLEKISFLNSKNSKLGLITYKYNGEVIKESDVYLSKPPEISLKKVSIKYWYVIVGVLFIFIVLFYSKKKKRKKKAKKY